MGNLKKNMTYNFLYQVLVLVLPFITAPYLSRVMGSAGLGVYSFSQSVVTYFTYITTLGLSNYGNRMIASVQTDKKKLSETFSEIYLMQCMCFVVGIALYVIYSAFFSLDKKAAAIMMIWMCSSALDINWFFFGIEAFKLTVIRNGTIKLLSVIAIFVFVKSEADIYVYIFIMAISTFLSQICLWPYLFRYIKPRKAKIKDILKHFKPNLVLFLPVVAVSIYRLMDKVMLGYLCTMDEVGYYENAEKIISMAQSLVVAVGTVMLPRMTAMYTQDRKRSNVNNFFTQSMNLVLAYTLAVTFGLMAIGQEFVNIYFGNGFSRTADILVLLSITLVFFGAGNVLRTQYIIPKKMDYIYVRSAFVGAAINLFVNILLIKPYGGIGAAIGTIAAEIAVCLYQFYKVRKNINLSQYFGSVVRYSIYGLIMLIVVRSVNWFENGILQIIFKVVVGALAFITMFGVDLHYHCTKNLTN